MKQVTATGQTVEDAIQSALEELNTTRDKVEVSIIDEGKRGIFGFGARPAIVKVTKIIDPIEEGKNFLLAVSEKMGAPAKVEVQTEGRQVTYLLSGEKIALLIGKRGQTLNSLQYLTQLIVNRHSDQYLYVMLDAENYRQRRNETLVHLAERMAEKVLSTGQTPTPAVCVFGWRRRAH